MYFEGARDFQTAFMGIGFIDKQTVLKDAKEKTLPKYLPVFEKVCIDVNLRLSYLYILRRFVKLVKKHVKKFPFINNECHVMTKYFLT